MNFNHFNELPKRDRNHHIERQAITAFESFLRSAETSFKQSSDESDYGTDYQLEITNEGHATNVRLQVQLKGTDVEANADGSVSISIKRTNLNYLLVQPYSFYVCYHIPTDSLRICFAEDVLRKYKGDNKKWTEQDTLTVSFSEPLTQGRLHATASLARLSAVASRNQRILQIEQPFSNNLPINKNNYSAIYIPEKMTLAARLLYDLYKSGQDEIISAEFERFASVLGDMHVAMDLCYLAEINLANAHKSFNAERISRGIGKLTFSLQSGAVESASMHYSIGNGFSALKNDIQAIEEYKISLEELSSSCDVELKAMIYKNMGTSFANMGEDERAIECNLKALTLHPQLAEAHYSLGLFYHRSGQYKQALEHFDKVVFSPDTQINLNYVTGWRIETLFNLHEGRAAFREINTLLRDADHIAWIWPWCVKQVSVFGRASIENAVLSLPFWERYIRLHSESAVGKREILLAKFYLRARGEDIHISYEQFKNNFESYINDIEVDMAALLWDRLGHWAQDENNWKEAECCFRNAYDLAGAEYSYCLGVALNLLGRFEESLPLLLEYMVENENDDLVWFQIATSYEFQGRLQDAIDSYQKCISLNSEYDLAWFNLGGIYWNSHNTQEASRIWKVAVEKFPEHELALKLRRDIPFIFL